MIWITKSLIRFRHVEVYNLDVWKLIRIKQRLNQIKIPQMKVDWFKYLWINSTPKKTSPEENNDTNQDVFIRFTYDMIQRIMNRIKLHESQETEAKRMIDMNQSNVNRIKHLEKEFFHPKRNKRSHLSSKNHMT